MRRQFSTGLGECSGSDQMSRCGRRGWCCGGAFVGFVCIESATRRGGLRGRRFNATGAVCCAREERCRPCHSHAQTAGTRRILWAQEVLVCAEEGGYVIPAGDGGAGAGRWVMEVGPQCTASGVAPFRPPGTRALRARGLPLRAKPPIGSRCGTEQGPATDAGVAPPPPTTPKGHKRCAVPNEGALEDVPRRRAPLWRAQGPPQHRGTLRCCLEERAAPLPTVVDVCETFVERRARPLFGTTIDYFLPSPHFATKALFPFDIENSRNSTACRLGGFPHQFWLKRLFVNELMNA